ncbi:MAG: putative quinol monooxygenase [Hyphomicrobiales bacterium]|nr:putative quinol monooxygenase [Hyphomicrobiales bacterium]
MPAPFALLVTIKLKPGMAEPFQGHILKNAEASVREEADCHQFQVMTVIDDPDTFIFYEVYSDEAALERHRREPHFLEYMQSTRDMIAARSVTRCAVIKT